MDKPFTYTSLDGTKSFSAVLHLSWNGAKFNGADVICRKMSLVGLSEQEFLQLCFEGVDTRARAYDADSPAPPSAPAGSGS